MFPAQDLATASLMTSLGVVLIAAFLGLRQWYEWRARETDLTAEDQGHFFHQDLRRSIGVAVMLFVAIGLWLGARIPPKVGGRVNVAFVQAWLIEISLLVVLLLLAVADWVATRMYARRHRQSMARERRAIIRDTLREAYRPPADEPAEPNHNST